MPARAPRQRGASRRACNFGPFRALTQPFTMPTPEDDKYVTQHQEQLAAFFAEAMALVVEGKPDDPVQFMRVHFASSAMQSVQEQLTELEELHSFELEELRIAVRREESERQRLEERVAAIEKARDLMEEFHPAPVPKVVPDTAAVEAAVDLAAVDTARREATREVLQAATHEALRRGMSPRPMTGEEIAAEASELRKEVFQATAQMAVAAAGAPSSAQQS